MLSAAYFVIIFFLHDRRFIKRAEQKRIAL